MGNSKSCNFFEQFSPNAQAPCKCKHKETHVFLLTCRCMSTYSIVSGLVFLTWLLRYQWLWRCLAVLVLWPSRWVFGPIILFFVANFAIKPALTNKLLLVSVVLGWKALQGCVDVLHRGMPGNFTLICPFLVLLQPLRV